MDDRSFPHDVGTDETCIGCGDEVRLVADDDGGASVQCGCLAASVLVPLIAASA